LDEAVKQTRDNVGWDGWGVIGDLKRGLGLVAFGRDLDGATFDIVLEGVVKKV
jgi:hypothetical protein